MKVKMYKWLAVFLLVGLAASWLYAQKNQTALFAKQNLVAWCIVPYDKVKRTPEQRAEMLQELGIKKFAYDWRDEHLPTMAHEMTVMRKAGIQVKAVWFWVDGGSGQVLDKTNEFILATLKQQGVKTELWLSFHEKYLAGLPEAEKLKKAVAAVTYLNKRAQEIGCTIMLYNHGDWFGEPENQIKIIKAVSAKNIGMVYNFHHAHQQANKFPALLRQMKPYLTTVNINGMRMGALKYCPSARAIWNCKC